ncbi:DMT family transporter [Vibrio rhodolitus]|uniref:DMT family transporter n=1 Tax=Vibrio rhodolitus TaxID=2231649 RepID=UPI000E0AD6D0|nr:DMT family transporter [Vibrio rhodolitus]
MQSGRTTLLLTSLAPIIWGSTYIVTTEWLPENSPLMASAIRALPAGLLLVLFTRTLPNSQWWLKLASLGILNIGLFFYCLFYAATYLPGGTAALLMASQPVIVMLLSWYLLNTKLTWRQGIASVISFAGVALLAANSEVSLNVAGVVLALTGTVSMASGVVLTKKWGRPENMSMLSFTGWQLLFGGIFLLPIALWVEGVPSQLTTINYIGYGYLSVFGALLAYYLWFRGIDQLPTVSVSFLGFLSSVSACLLGYFFLNEKLSALQIIGAFAVLLAIALASPFKFNSLLNFHVKKRNLQ